MPLAFSAMLVGATVGTSLAADKKKGGAGGANPLAVDPAIPLQYFQQAADKQKAGFDEGLTYLKPALQEAHLDAQQGYSKANSTLSTLSYSSNQAMNEQLRMLGLDPISATAGYGQSFSDLRDQYKDSPLKGYGDQVNGLQSQLSKAEQIKDPGERETARQQILGNINGLGTTMTTDLQNQIATLSKQAPPIYHNFDDIDSALGSGRIVDPWLARHMNGLGRPLDQYGRSMNDSGNIYDTEAGTPAGYMAPDGHSGGIDTYKQSLITKSQTDYMAWQQKLQGLTDQLGTANTIKDQLSQFGSSWDSSYGTNFDKGYTGEEVGQKVASLPGYQFDFDQGSEALQRTSAAQGLTGSGNTQLALQNFGQAQAEKYYNSYMGYLSGVTAAGSGATSQIAANQSNEGLYFAGLAQQYGQAQMDTARQEATYAANMLSQSGYMYADIAKFNATMANKNASQNSAQASQSSLLQQQQNGQMNIIQQNQAALDNASRKQAAGALYGGL